MDAFLQKDAISLVLEIRKQDDFSSSGIANVITLSRHKNSPIEMKHMIQ